MIRKIATLAAAALLSVVASATVAKDDPGLEAAVEAYLRSAVMQRMMDDMWSIDTLRSMLVLQLRAQGADLRGEQIEALTRILKEELERSRPQLMSVLRRVSIETFSLDEVQALNEFYSTSIGASAVLKAGAVMRSFSAAAAPEMQRLFKRLSSRLEAEFPK